MLGPPPTEWTRTTWFFVILAAAYAIGFVVFWFRFQAAEAAARRGGAEAAERFNEMLRGFPNTMYAKMFGKRPFEAVKGDDDLKGDEETA